MKTAYILFILYASSLAQPPYYPFGPQTNVPKANLGGWTECWSSNYSTVSSISTILSACGGDYLLLACGHPSDNNTLTLLAAGTREAITKDTGETDTPTNNNGVGWYFNSNWSWGFAKEGDEIHRYRCDTVDTAILNGTNGDARLCWNADGE